MRSGIFLKLLTIAAILIATGTDCSAEDLSPLIQDLNGDGAVKALSFGDSLTFGVGDNGLTADAAKKGGYPDRAEILLNVPFDNFGQPGEEFTEGGLERLLALLRSSTNDYFLILEGANDAYRAISSEIYRNSMQRAVNAAAVLRKTPVIMTLPIPCCEHGAQVPTTVRYISELHTIALANDIPLIDIDKAWRTTCAGQGECDLYTLPEGLHPSARGYDVIAQTVAARFLGIDIFASGGAVELEQALGLPAGTVLVKPEITAE